MPFQPPPALKLTRAEPFTGLDSTVGEFRRMRPEIFAPTSSAAFLRNGSWRRPSARRNPCPNGMNSMSSLPLAFALKSKSSAYLQAWPQRRLSTIAFSGLNAAKWDAELGPSDQRTFNAHVYVFCVHTARSHADYDTLDVSQWDFNRCCGPALSQSVTAASGWRGSRVRRNRSVSTAFAAQLIRPPRPQSGTYASKSPPPAGQPSGPRITQHKGHDLFSSS